MAATQENRRIELKTPLGKDVLLLRSCSVEDQLGRLFQIQLDLLSTNWDINFDDIVGQSATLRVDMPNGEPRFFNGLVNRFVQTGGDGKFAHYEATLVPWLWFLTLRADCRVFQSTMPEPPRNMTVPEIVKKVFSDHGYSDFVTDKLTEKYPVREYCVQYRETDFNFVSRLMEQEGIYYYFDHEDGKHTLVLADSLSAHDVFPDYATIPYRPESQSAPDREIITDWVLAKAVQSGVYVLNDFDYDKPKKPLLAKSQLIAKHAVADSEVYDYPGEYLEYGDGETYTKTRIEELHARHEIGTGQATARGLQTGSTFKLADYPRHDQNREYLTTGTSYHFQVSEFESTGSGAGGEFCRCTFTAIPSDVAYRSERTTPKPLIQGVQTAIVVGPSGDEIYTDEHARVKVQFHWDRNGKNDENSSCWVRVSHANAGKGWGSMITPRIGQEVIVEFLEGDPDRPIVTGRVYNGDQRAPFADDQGVVSGVKSQTHKGSGYNEISMDDTAGKEKITVHGQYDMNTTIEHDLTETIKNDVTIKVTEGKYNHDVAAGEATYHVQGALSEKYDSTQETTVAGKITIKSGAEVLIDAASKITLKTGASTLTMDAGGNIKIEGVNVTVEGSAKMETKGALVTSQASGSNTVKGAVVLVN
jgi:type VI secretion system secreted protein VgrG